MEIPSWQWFAAFDTGPAPVMTEGPAEWLSPIYGPIFSFDDMRAEQEGMEVTFSNLTGLLSAFLGASSLDTAPAPMAASLEAVEYDAFATSFDPFDPANWRPSDYANAGGWIATAWDPDHVVLGTGSVSLQLEHESQRGKPYTGAEIRSEERYFYGQYEVTMQVSDEDGVLSSFFLYTGAPHGTLTSEIDFEFLGDDTTKVLLTFHTPEGSDGQLVDLGFDAAAGFHTYTIDWAPDSITWYADGVALRQVTDADIGIPAEPSFMFMSIWTGANGFTGTPRHNVSATATYEDVSYVPRSDAVAINDRALVTAGGSVAIDVLANDGIMGGAPLPETVTIDQGPAHGTVSVDAVTGVITYTANAGYVGRDSFSYTMSDGSTLSNSGDVTLSVGLPIDADFTSGADGFTYADDAFRGTAQPDYADGSATGGTLDVLLGGGSSRSAVTDISGGWSQEFDALAGQQATLTLRYRITLSADLDAGEEAEVMVALDGTEYSLMTLAATDSDTETLDSGWIEVTLDLGTLSGGSHELVLGGFLNQRTRQNETATISFDSAVITLGSPSPADDDGNLALSAPDLLIDGAEAGAVDFVISGLDADATAEVTVTDGTNTVTGTIATNGTLTLDLSSLDDGPLTSSVTATDGDGATATAGGPGLTLVPAAGDDDGNLALSLPDTEIDATEMSAVSFVVTGIDANATAEVFVTDGTSTISGSLAADGTLLLDLTGLADGALTTSVTATDINGATTTLAGPGLTLDSAPPVVLPTPIDADFTSGADGFTYADDAFRGTAQPDYADGSATGGTLDVLLGGGSSRSAVTDISGGWSQEFDALAGQQATLTLRYRITLSADLDAGEEAEVMVALDGTEYSLMTLAATDSDTETLDSGWIEVTLDLGTLSGGSHELVLGGFLNQRTRQNETATISFDSAVITLGSPSPADDDGNLALSAPDLLIDGAEAGAVDFVISGLDADATAEVTVTDGTNTVTGTIATNGTLTLDLSSLDDGPLTSSVTATDGDGATATAGGPGLTLVPAAGDDDGNLALSLPDTEIDATEMSAVSFVVTGIDANATAEVFVTDGTSTISGSLAADGTLLLDLTGLADGALTTSVTATDINGATTTLAGPGLTLDSAPPVVLPTPIDADFTSGADGFTYADDAFRGTAQPDYADGSATGGTLDVLLGGGSSRSAVTDISGGWSQEFDALAGQQATLTLRYRITLSADLDAGEEAEVMVALDGTEYSLMTLAATDSDTETLDSGWIEVTLDLGTLSGGSHELVLGGFLNQRTRQNETATISFDSAVITLGSPSPADDDGNLALSAPDLLIDGAEAGAVDFVISGLDADATAEVTVTDGTNSVTGTIATNGTLTLDLSSLDDGPLTSSVTATDGDGASVTVTGPELMLEQVSLPLDFSTETEALSIDLTTGTYGYAAVVLPIGDSLTHGYLGDTDAVTQSTRELQDGYRGTLFESLLADGVFIDYAGRFNSGSELMLDNAHSGTPGIEIRQIMANGIYEDDLAAYDPDIVLFMAGTNDISSGGTRFFDVLFPRVINGITQAISEFYDLPGASDKHLVISTLPPKGNLTDEVEMVNEGYSIVDGVAVVGDAGNGTYVAGIKATVMALQSSHATLHLYDAPFDQALMGDDEDHMTEEGYAAYAAGLQELLETEIGYSGGTLDGTALNLGTGQDVEGGSAGDLIGGSDQDNILLGGGGNDVLLGRAGNDTLGGGTGSDRLEGGAGADVLTGGADADVFVFGTDFADGAAGPDTITDFGDGADRLLIADDFEGLVTVEDHGSGVRLTLGSAGVIDVEGTSADLLKGADLGGGVFDLTTDTDLALFYSDSIITA
ncbi:family 16 glycosylhydrolase [Marinibacterium sp. SX1]|uniref:family 16 glycosylhydrolase n=1 Tax=Marinibacterium sp. SX1 TaxID=3388424 RepID=UPI003D17A2D5